MHTGSCCGQGESFLLYSVHEAKSWPQLLLGDELRDLVKGFLASPRTPEGNHDALQPGSAESSSVWLRALRWCPRELLDLVNSKACRGKDLLFFCLKGIFFEIAIPPGAIMFNDTLTREQCQKLVRQLADTVFPFQCAHGR